MATPQQPLTNDPMARAIALARKAIGTASPNPPVGAVIVKDGHIVGEGYTQPPGQAHAEIMALDQAGEDARGADLYVTLEPCAHQGRTPPCTSAIIAAGIRRVHIAALDPNPRTDGRGVARLEEANVSVVLGEGNPDSNALIEAFAKHITTGKPFVIAKFAMSLDGKIATRAGDSKWISNVAARKHAHALRAGVDAVMVGIGTALADDPQLTVRDVPHAGPQPTRVVIDSTGRLPVDSAMLTLEGTTIVATSDVAPDQRTALETAGATIVDTGPGTQVDLRQLLATLGERQITSVLVEGGSHLLGSLFDLGLVDKVVGIIAPVIIGGTEAPGPVGGRGAHTIPDALRLTQVTYEQVDGDIIVTGYPPARST
jgi:diaminohydroxyphosphoribosylaminopyrimidine deaminase / 5-amino-6-(5-phosphoribosylamino)uracil reductase